MKESAIDARIDDAGSILKSRIGFCPCFSTAVSQLRPSLVIGFGGIQAIDAEFPYWVPVVDRGEFSPHFSRMSEFCSRFFV